MTGAARIEVRDLLAIGRSGLVLGPLSFRVDDGQALAVLGATGSGKSLLLAALTGLVPTTRGRVEHNGTIAMVFQRDALDDGVSALENVALAARARAIPSPVERARDALTRVGLAGHEHKLPRALSGGMRKRVGIARALVVEPTVLIADDPTAGLDPATAREVLALLLDSDGRGATRTLVIATQDPDVVLPRVHHALVLDEGQPRWLGEPAGLERVDALRAFAPREERPWL